MVFNGAGINNEVNCDPLIRDCIFSSNLANFGAGIFNYVNSNSTVNNCLLYENSSSALYEEDSDVVYTNCTIADNNGFTGGAIFLKSASNTTFNNFIIYNNTATTGDEFYLQDNSTITLNHCIFNNSAGYAFIQGGSSIISSNDNLNSDPLFIDDSNDDYRISLSSPAIDAGDNTYNYETYDIRGSDFGRKLNNSDASAGIIDIGAYEYKAETGGVLISSIVSSITNISVSVITELTSNGGQVISSKGVVISQEQNPTISNRRVESGNGGGNYTTSVTGLEPLTTYYISVYVISSGVTS